MAFSPRITTTETETEAVVDFYSSTLNTIFILNYSRFDIIQISLYIIQSFAKILAATEYQYISISGALWVIK